MVRCKLCGAIFDQRPPYTKHMKSIHNITPKFQCGHCNEWIPDDDTFDWHLTHVHGTVHWHLLQKTNEVRRFFDKLDE
jgi:uncharacterized C2H2 Zn-finger protein